MIAAALEAEVDDYVSSFSDELDEAGRRLRRVVEDRPKGLILPPSERIQRYEPSECRARGAVPLRAGAIQTATR